MVKVTKPIVLHGRGASPGTATGPARVLQDPFEDVDQDAVEENLLVAPYFTPVSLPQYTKGRGIVTDHGGMTSHAAIIARELGIPCVVATEDATQIIENGDEVKVDGKTGEVTIL